MYPIWINKRCHTANKSKDRNAKKKREEKRQKRKVKREKIHKQAGMGAQKN